MPRAKTNGIEIEYDTFGASDAKPMLLIMGLGGQMVLWDEAFCALLAKRGFRVIRFDNRDIGKSTHMDAAGVPDLGAVDHGGAHRRAGERRLYALRHGRRHRRASRCARTSSAPTSSARRWAA